MKNCVHVWKSRNLTYIFVNLGLLFLADPIYIPFVFS
jgi:hypothetical protein